jgi:YesN/AraC family two-component response regulator
LPLDDVSSTRATRPSAAFGILHNVKIHAVITDVVMPEMDGYDFYLKVKESCRRCR